MDALIYIIDWYASALCHLHTDVQRKETSACSIEVFHGQACHARSIVPHLDKIFNYTASEEEITLAHSSVADQVVQEMKSQAY